ncbi:hypothetical protein [Chroococcidiopsis sp. CCMEE 29]|uniref:hypothetical protein n=1 Tax=Chroococcidiopsis sp. CCMEE 29 TaxID=155894 RepID=UPI002021BF28|nr:hypothetical protein [Chroococcidiopsis sp. CCMEE 29]
MADNREVLEALAAVSAELRISRHQQWLSKVPPKLAAVVTHILQEPNEAVRVAQFKGLAETLPSGFEDRITKEFLLPAQTAQQWLETRGQKVEVNRFEPLDPDRKRQLDKYADELRSLQERVIDNQYTDALKNARWQDAKSNPNLKGAGINELGILRDMAEKKSRIDVTKELLQKETELQEDRARMQLKVNNPLLGE